MYNAKVGIYPARKWQAPILGYYPTKTTSRPKVSKSPTKGAFNPPKHEIDSFARCVLPAIQAYFETEAGNREFAEWQAKQQAKNKTA